MKITKFHNISILRRELQRYSVPFSPATASDFEKAKPRFTDKKGRVRGSWSRLTLDQLAEKAGDDLAAAYTPVYAFSSCYIHASLTDLLRRIETENELTRIVVDASVYAPGTELALRNTPLDYVVLQRPTS